MRNTDSTDFDSREEISPASSAHPAFQAGMRFAQREKIIIEALQAISALHGDDVISTARNIARKALRDISE
jgi:hypothetical protein